MNGSTTSCGCVRRETTIAFNKTKKKPKGQRKQDDRSYKMYHNAQHRSRLRNTIAVVYGRHCNTRNLSFTWNTISIYK